MTDWLRDHLDNPYPNDIEKDFLIESTKLTINQLNYWFTNARRRIIPKWASQKRSEEREEKARGEEQQPGGNEQSCTGSRELRTVCCPSISW